MKIGTITPSFKSTLIFRKTDRQKDGKIENPAERIQTETVYINPDKITSLYEKHNEQKIGHKINTISKETVVTDECNTKYVFSLPIQTIQELIEEAQTKPAGTTVYVPEFKKILNLSEQLS